MAVLFLSAIPVLGAAPALAQGGAPRIVLKLRDGSGAALEQGELTATGADLAPLRRLLAERGVRRGALSPTFSRSRSELRAERERGERRARRRLPDLALFFTIEVPAGTDLEALATSLRELALVESAEPWPTPAPPPLDIDPPTPDFTSMQTYTAAAPAGIGTAALTGVAGADGAGTRFVDIEYGWRLDHEDLELPASVVIQTGTPKIPSPDPEGNHGTAVLGILSARANAYGVTGIVPAAEAHVAASYTNERGWDVGYAIEQALLALGPTPGPGDVILLEQQALVCPPDPNSVGYLGPVEWYPAWHAVIEIAAAQGVLVVEAAGNGSLDLDSASCDGAFDLALDSGALLVTAGSSASHAPLSTANYGSRIDLQGIGEGITTLGGGTLFGGGDPLQRYQANFGGSSSASAMVAGVALALQGLLLAHGEAPLDPYPLRLLLAQTGTAQAAGTEDQPIGSLPDLARAYAVAVPPPPPTPVPILPPSGALALGGLLFAVAALRVRLR